MSSNKINISLNKKEKEKEKIEDNNDFSNIKISKEYESFPLTDLNEKDLKNISKTKFNEAIELIYEEIPYLLYLNLKFDDTIKIELVSKEGHIPYSFRNILDKKKFEEMNPIFEEIDSIEKIYNKVINLLRKNRISIIKDKDNNIFYLILTITIIDEDKKIYIPLNKNENIQISTINYLLREAQLLKNELGENEIKIILEKENNDLNSINKNNEYYNNIINIINSDKKEFDKISKIIIEQNDDIKEMKNKINIIEDEIILLKNNVKCKFSQKNIVFYLDIKGNNHYYLFHFGIKNTGNLILSSKYDKIFFEIQGISQEKISFVNSLEKYVNFTNDDQTLLPKEKINICKKLIIKNLEPNKKYEFYINIYSLCHGLINDEPVKIIILTSEFKDKNFISLLKNKNLDFDISNQKVIFEYLEEINFIEEDKNKDFIINKKKFKIYSYLYNNKKGIIENRDEEWNYIDNYLVINKEYIENIINKINDKYKDKEKLENKNLADIICSCAGDFNNICKFIEKI